ncbi:hypothetical protein G6F57_013576 [Rhizopus arrhizus]|uniref:GDP/GTP exchange factor Sec2 N-terminal domain-containing protein n=1 Tax=Rhizopus oryzae TaxID=64495 RepID=A0A9P6WXY3_RHIOR|nr:hypothetical protein G6F23_011205 [Rhizopus arrhizus]KAG0806499.1 hypothetical protein G6F20_011074 [Rhizopus arrhizus]KAG0823068.1 hypothetical protein G6F19_011049 [Rhizopus arrhizus]KAG0834893.1 hypothetical protein G6F18_006093 [Rhizopus arrhizus]KAG0890627.1 hypothetical protein G6F34_012366 [Rhizopus arrhizus]
MTTQTTCESPLVIQLSDQSSCQCKDFVFTDCTDCQPILSSAFQATQTQLFLLKSQKESLVKKGQSLADLIRSLEQPIREKSEARERTIQGIESLQHDLKVLREKCEDEAIQVEVIQKSKETVKKELEDLNTRLFEEVDKMVRLEREEQERIRQENEDLEHALKDASDRLEDVLGQLEALKDQMKKRPHTAYDCHFRAQLEMMARPCLGYQLETVKDETALMDLNDFIQLAGQTPLRKLHSLRYMKYCIREDIEPCLRFGPNPRLATKKIMDSILVKTCFVEECPEGFREKRQSREDVTATLWERFKNNHSNFSGCQACGRRVKEEERGNVLRYRFRISYFDEWACVDRYCRDRLVAVIEFYSFIRHLRTGFYKHQSIHELYQQTSRLRLQMLLARMGALPYLLSSCHLDTQEVITAFHGQENGFPYLDSTNERLSSSTDSTITSTSSITSFTS